MDFFEYTSAADTVIRTFSGRIDLPIAFIVGGLCFAVVYIFMSVGLFTIARREGLKWQWMAFVPILNTFYIGVCGQKNKLFKIDTKIVSLIAAIAELLLCVLYILYFSSYASLDAAGCIKISAIQDPDMGIWQVDPEVIIESVPSKLNWAMWYIKYRSIFIGILDIIYGFALIFTLICFFQTYAARRYFIFTIASVFFPVKGILIFSVRNNKGMRYADYIRAQQERVYRQYRTQQSFYQDPYNQNPYSGNRPPYENGQPQQPPQSEPQQNNQPEDPFPEFDSSKSDPFDEFKN